jgi:acyl carrier protein
VTPDDARAAITRVLAGIAPEADIAARPADTDLAEDLDLDSMDFLNFVTGLLETTGVEVPERDYPRLQTLGGCIDYLVEHADAGAG